MTQEQANKALLKILSRGYVQNNSHLRKIIAVLRGRRSK
jgi:hypothetical protein